ncbi:hypothetical protein C380_13960 [Acidovorax sp. KKS102]|uniref:hypothetical protein n=1 Tax=Acidovorax sp. KKS102 TaxID=358220 RepID=UPI00028AF891|nr:hypothetical protein [Acidovorax sp. KKS102]AFU46491.1 hypothetical protein C380_13960 [Acidovorax sp. KKS102]
MDWKPQNGNSKATRSRLALHLAQPLHDATLTVRAFFTNSVNDRIKKLLGTLHTECNLGLLQPQPDQVTTHAVGVSQGERDLEFYGSISATGKRKLPHQTCIILQFVQLRPKI